MNVALTAMLERAAEIHGIGPWRTVYTDTENADGIAPVCLDPDHPIDHDIRDCCAGTDIETFSVKLADYMAALLTYAPSLLAEHARLKEENARLAAQVAAVRALIPASWYEVPPDGTVLIATYSGGYGREDLPPRERVWVRSDQDTPPKDPDGDWYQVGDPDDHRASYGEVLAHDDPPCDRPTVTTEELVSVYAIARALDGVA